MNAGSGRAKERPFYGVGVAAGWLVFAALAIAASKSQGAGPPPFPTSLASTGLYSDFAGKLVDPANLHYLPQYPLWSDGAAKSRWIRLPSGTAIDASDPDVWLFPAGTKIWKEFSFGRHRVETRLIESLGNGELRFAAYAWNADETEAVLVPETGRPDAVEIAPGIRHDIPSVYDCRACHVSRIAEVLGFSALQLSPDRDPNAPHATAVTPGMANLDTIMDRGLLRNFPAEWRDRPPRITATPTARAALGTLHANCGNCHNANSPLIARGLILRHSVAPGAHGEPAIVTGVNIPTLYPIPGVPPGQAMMIRPGDPARSAVVYRMSTRNPLRQMPPLGTKIVDAESLAVIKRWIRNDLTASEMSQGPCGPALSMNHSRRNDER
jgi:hypothetical protein